MPALLWLLIAAVLPAGATSAPADPRRRTAIVEAVELAQPAVVNIATEEISEERDPVFDKYFREFFELRPPNRRFRRASLGSGVMVRADGFVVTNAHVVTRGQRIRVVLADEREFEARLIGTDNDADLAVLKIEGLNFPYLAFGTAADLMIGEPVIAIGNPFGFSHSVTTGVVSAINRSLRTPKRSFFDFIQTDASINPGNSGGPLLDATGELVGINTAIYQGAQNIGFAIPAERANEVVRQLIEHGEVRPGWLGLQVQALDPELAQALDLDVEHGALVSWVDAAGPAAEAGIARGDVVVEIDGHRAKEADAVEERLLAVPEGGRLQLKLQRGSEAFTARITASSLTSEHLDTLAWSRIGIRVESLGAQGGLRLAAVRPGTKAARAGLKVGDRLLAIEDVETRNRDDLDRALRRLRRADRVRLVIQRGPSAYRLILPLQD